jgi:hypothetical protein
MTLEQVVLLLYVPTVQRLLITDLRLVMLLFRCFDTWFLLANVVLLFVCLAKVKQAPAWPCPATSGAGSDPHSVACT